MSNGADKYSPDDRATAIDAVVDAIQGTVDVSSPYDAYSSLELPELKEELKGLLGQDLTVRTELQFKLALYRSLRYAAASSKHCLVLGAVNNIRELYEGIRLLYPSEKDPDA